MAQMKKKEYQLSINTYSGGQEELAGAEAEAAITALLAGQPVHFTIPEEPDTIVYIPYHEISMASWETTVSDETIEDATCVGGESGGGGGSGTLLFSETINVNDDDDGESPYCGGAAQYVPTYLPQKITVVYDGVEYANLTPSSQASDRVTFGGYPFTDMPFSISFVINQYVSNVSFSVALTDCGEHTFEVYDVA